MKAFGPLNSAEKMAELVICYDELKANPLSTSLANIFCLYSWHIIDWISFEYFNISGGNKLGDYRLELFLKCEHLKTMGDIANSLKHYNLKDEKAYIKEAKKQLGPFTKQFTSEFKQSSLIIEYQDGVRTDFHMIADGVLAFWIGYFKDELSVEVKIPFPYNT